MSLSTEYDGSFGGVSFWEQVDGAQAVEPDLEEQIAVLKIPGGNHSVVQSFGQIAQTLDLSVAVMSAQLSSLRAKVGTSGSLVYHAGTVSARLTKFGRPRKITVDTDGYTVTLSFILL